MKDIHQIFHDEFQKLGRPSQTGFKNCFNIAGDLIRIATYADFKEGVLVSKVLEGVFVQVGPLLDNFDVPINEKSA